MQSEAVSAKYEVEEDRAAVDFALKTSHSGLNLMAKFTLFSQKNKVPGVHPEPYCRNIYLAVKIDVF